MTDSDTPKADALYKNPLNSNDSYAWQSLAYELERALTESRKEVSRLEGELGKAKQKLADLVDGIAGDLL